MNQHSGLVFIDYLKNVRTMALLRKVLGEDCACYQRLCGDGVLRNLWICVDHKSMSAFIQPALEQGLPYKLYVLNGDNEIVPLRKLPIPKYGSIPSLPRVRRGQSSKSA